MSLPIEQAGSTSTWLSRPTLGIDDSPAGLATSLVQDAQTSTGVDLAKLHAGIGALAERDPALAQATHEQVAAKLDPVDAGHFLSGLFDDIGDLIKGVFGKIEHVIDEAAKKAQTEGVDGNPATTAPGLATPKTPGDAPATINFSRTLQGQFDTQWDNSFPGGTAQEQGGTLVFDKKTGQIDMINIGGSGSTSGSFTPDYSIPDPSKTGLLGVFHTHPYDDGSTGISFSGADVAVMINEHHNIIMAQSGDKQFVMMRTAETPANIDYTAANNAQNARIGELVGQGKSFADAASQAASEIATKYHLAYYEGSNGHLTRINP